MTLVFFDDHLWHNLHPITLTRPSAEIRIGIHTISEKWKRALDIDTIAFKTADYLSAQFPQDDNNPENLYINGRLLPSVSVLNLIQKLSNGQQLVFGDSVLAKKGNTENPESIVVQEADLICETWDIFLKNAAQIAYDIAQMDIQPLSKSNTELEAVTVHHPENIYIHPSAKIEPGCFLLAEEGPIYLGEDSLVMAASIIRGQNAICDHATIKMGAKMYPGSTIGPYCKVGGEVQNSVFHSYSNKGHDGYIGNSVIGQWCNFGAGTDTSNLKNNYSMITVNRWNSGEKIATGQQFVGTIMGDHSKVAIGTKMNTATQCGVFANVFSGGFPPKIIPNFSWMGDATSEIFTLDKALEMANNMMKRRDVDMSEAYTSMITYLFQLRTS